MSLETCDAGRAGARPYRRQPSSSSLLLLRLHPIRSTFHPLGLIVRRDGSRGCQLTAVDIQLLTGRKSFFGDSIDFWRDRPEFRANAGWQSFAAINV